MTAGSIAVPTIIPLRPPIPGRSKIKIDDQTPIEITAEDNNFEIYFTVDGSKPIVHPPVGSKLSTYFYKKPFKLKAGKATVRALSCTKDGMRESSVVSKTFHVEHDPKPVFNGKEEDDLQFLNIYSSNNFQVEKNQNPLVKPKLPSKENWSKVEDRLHLMKFDATKDSLEREQKEGKRHIHSGGSTSILDSLLLAKSSISLGSSLGASEVNPDYWKCRVCKAARPADPNARYCHECGSAVPPFPSSHLPPTHSGQMSICSNCYNMIPLNVTSCIVCEKNLPGIEQQTVQNGFSIKEKLICSICKTPNPLSLQSCLFCESDLKNAKLELVKYQDYLDTYSVEKHVTCSTCSRSNPASRTQCQHCHKALKNQISHLSITCTSCNAKNHAYARYCLNCGMILSEDFLESTSSHTIPDMAAPVRPRLSSDVTFPLHISKSRNQSTQTVGLFVPGKWPGEAGSRPPSSTSHSRPLVVGAVSPGKGYWRQQVEHIAGHLKSYTHGNAEFRAMVGQPRMGGLRAANVETNAEGEEVTITLTFTSKSMEERGDDARGMASGRSSRLSSMDTLSTASSTSIDSVATAVDRKQRKVRVREETLSGASSKLIKEVSSEKRGDAGEVERLIEDGADVNCVNSSKVPVLNLAVLNRLSLVLPFLLEAGADVNRKYGSLQNTALHDAVKLGPAYTDIIDILLRHGARVQSKNKQGVTPNDMAAKAGYSSIMQLFASHLGHNMINKLIK